MAFRFPRGLEELLELLDPYSEPQYVPTAQGVTASCLAGSHYSPDNALVVELVDTLS